MNKLRRLEGWPGGKGRGREAQDARWRGVSGARGAWERQGAAGRVGPVRRMEAVRLVAVGYGDRWYGARVEAARS